MCMEYEVKWALESITRKKASGRDGIAVELFQILKDNAVKVLHVSKCFPSLFVFLRELALVGRWTIPHW